jgi:mannose-6-phosphate isomerase-like protein (cupin superfamily)
MTAEPVIVHEDDRDWEGWRPEDVAERGDAQWRTLISGGLTPSAALTAGIARLPSGGRLSAHRHEQPEVYFVLDGTGVVTIDGAPSPIRPGTCVFIPGDALHSVESTGPADLRVAYVFPADAFEDVTYRFEP